MFLPRKNKPQKQAFAIKKTQDTCRKELVFTYESRMIAKDIGISIVNVFSSEHLRIKKIS